MAHVESSYLNLPPSLRRTLKHYRRLHALSQQQLAARLNVPVWHVQKREQDIFRWDETIIWRGVVAMLGMAWDEECPEGSDDLEVPAMPPRHGDAAMTREERQF